jgi:ketosteroid isomerase-like protein
MRNLLIIWLMLTFFSTVSAQDKNKVFKQTKAANDASLQGHVERNVDKIIAVYTDDAIILPPGGVQPIQGIKAIRDYYTKGIEAGRVLSVTTENLSYELIDAMPKRKLKSKARC